MTAPILLAGVALAATAAAVSSNPKPASYEIGMRVSHTCQLVADLWCNADGTCMAAMEREGLELPLVARFNLKKAGQWKCYSPSALDKTKAKYTEGPGFCSASADILEVLAICNGTKPGPYPSILPIGPPPRPGGPAGGRAPDPDLAARGLLCCCNA